MEVQWEEVEEEVLVTELQEFEDTIRVSFSQLSMKSRFWICLCLLGLVCLNNVCACAPWCTRVRAWRHGCYAAPMLSGTLSGHLPCFASTAVCWHYR
jgi:hypothetical protein